VSGGTVTMTAQQLRRRECSYRGDAVMRLSGQEAKLLAVLIARRGQIVPRREIVEYLYPGPDGGPLSAEKRVSVLLAALRRIMPGLTILSRKGRGVALVTDRAPPDA
jgi:DNA-binding response OmpR family regulator